MADELRLMCVLAHPDDESLGTGGILAKYAAEGSATYLVTATRGERGWQGDKRDDPGPDALGRIREAELRAAAEVLKLRSVDFLDYIDGDLDRSDPAEAVAKIVGHLRRARPHVVVTFAPDGSYGHPDHIAICQFTTAAVVAAADPGYADPGELAPHRVSKLYYMVLSQALADAYLAAFGDIRMLVDGIVRHAVVWPEWAITTRIDSSAHWRTVWQAVACHRSQLPGYHVLEHMPEQHQLNLWGRPSFYRAFSLVNGGRAIEDDLFAGLRVTR